MESHNYEVLQEQAERLRNYLKVFEDTEKIIFSLIEELGNVYAPTDTKILGCLAHCRQCRMVIESFLRYLRNLMAANMACVYAPPELMSSQQGELSEKAKLFK